VAVEEDLVAFLEANTAELTSDRIWPNRRPQNASVPGVVYQRIDTPRAHAHSGPSGLAHPRFQFSCWGRTLAEAAGVAEQLRLAIDGYQGDMGDTYVCSALVANEIDDEDIDTGTWRRIVDVIIWHREAVA
jgi:hypothetical protein